MMYKKVLVCGGTLQMGKYVVKSLLEDGYDVTIANRGQHKDDFGDKVKRIIFDRSDEKSIIDPTMDVEIFGKYIAPRLGINIRFVGEEPIDNVTRQYNDTMKRILPEYGVDVEIIKRKESDGQVISASRVRALLKYKNFDEIKKIVPKTTYDYLLKNYS